MHKPKRHGGAPRPLADLVAPCLGPALAAQGFAGAEIVTRWAEIAGPELARRSQPVKLSWPPRRAGAPSEGRDPATLLVRVESAFALELQLQAPVLVERVNRYFGWRCVGALKLKQSGAPPRPAPVPPAPPPDPAVEARLRAVVDGAEERLAGALLRLGRAVAAKGGSVTGC